MDFRRLPWIITVVGSVLALTILFNYSKVTTIQCQLDHQDCPPELLSSLQTIKKSVITSNTQLTIENSPYVLQNFYLVWPGKLIAHFQQVDASFAIQNRLSSELQFISDNGTVLQRKSDQHIPHFIVSNEIFSLISSRNTDMTALLGRCARVIKTQQSSSSPFQTLKIKAFEVQDAQTLIIHTEELRIFIDLLKLQTSFHALNVILEKSKSENLLDGIGEIDVRFAFPVLRPSTLQTNI